MADGAKVNDIAAPDVRDATQQLTKSAAGPEAGDDRTSIPTIAVVSTLFPSAVQPTAGLFIRERMFRVARNVPLVVISPQPWFPFQSLIRRFHPTFRPGAPRAEVQDGITVLYPRFLSVPGMLRRLDGISIALALWPIVRRLKREAGVGIIDAHFAYPCGYAATRVGAWLDVPVTITLRGTEARHLKEGALASRTLAAVRDATRVFSVSDSLRQLFLARGIRGDRIHVIGNGVDLDKFHRISQAEARRRLNLAPGAKVLVSVGGLVERKGFHRVIALLPALLRSVPELHYLIVGGPSPEGDIGPALRAQVRALGLQHRVTFTGALPPERIHEPLSAADVFVLSTSNEGWANVFLEAMACGLPVVTTDVGGNTEVVSHAHLGTIVRFGDEAAMEAALVDAFARDWDRDRIIAHARANTWNDRVASLLAHYESIAAERRRRREDPT